MSPDQRNHDSLAGLPFPLILAGPSGAGKTTVCDGLCARPDAHRFLFSVSLTTRSPRVGEKDGVDYGFIARREFEALVEQDQMLEHATVHGELYGTPRVNLEAARAANAHLLLDIDVQGARQVKAAVPEVVTIFLVPPTGGRIVERLQKRRSETPEQLTRRLAGARAELEAAGEFDYLVVNDTLDDAVELVACIVKGEGAASRRLGERGAEYVARIVRELEPF